MGLTFQREIAGPIPQARLNHRRATFSADPVRGQQPFWRKAFSMATRPERCQGDRDIGRAEGGCAGFRNTSAGGISQNRQRRDIGIFALICGHALRGIAFHMFDRAEVLLHSLFDIFHRHIILKIKPRAPGSAHIPKRRDLIGGGIGNRQGARLDPFAQRLGQSERLRLPLRQCALRAHLTGSSARRHQPGNGARLRCKTCQSRIPNRPTVHVTS